MRKALPWVVLVLVLGGFGVYAYRAYHRDDDGSRAADAPTAATPDASGGVVIGDRPVPGSCYETRAATAGASDVTPQAAPCDGLHNTVAVGEAQLPDPAGTAYDQQRVLAAGRELCEPQSTAFTGASTAEFTQLSIAPSRDRWDSGDRTVSCLVRREGPDVVGPLTQ